MQIHEQLEVLFKQEGVHMLTALEVQCSSLLLRRAQTLEWEFCRKMIGAVSRHGISFGYGHG